MRTAPSFDSSVFAGSHSRLAYADAWYSDQLVADNMTIGDGQIVWTLDADVQSQLTLTVIDPDGLLAPQIETDPLAPFGQEINISMSATTLGQGISDPISLGWFRIQEPESDQRWLRTASGGWRSGGATVDLTALDRMQAIVDDVLIAPEQPPTGATVFSEITRLSNDLVPIGSFDDRLTDTNVPSSVVYDGDRVAAMVSLAGSIGGALRFNSDGALCLIRPTQAGDAPVHTFAVGADGNVVSYKTRMTRDGAYGAVVATGEASADHAPVMGIAYDLDPSSPTRWGGPFGKVLARYSSPLLTTPSMCGTAARTRLNNLRRGREREWVFDAVPNFLLELDDPVSLSLPDRIVAGRISRIALPLRAGAGTMSVSVRALDSSITDVEV